MSNGSAPQSPIPAINGTCPDGYVYDLTSDQCFFVSPPISVTATGVTLPDVDPRNAGELTGLGTGDSGLPEREALAHWQALRRISAPAASTWLPEFPKGGGLLWDIATYVGSLILDGYDSLVNIGVKFEGDSATRNNPGFWRLIGTLISDLLGVTLDGNALYQDMQQRGTLPAMRGVGASLVNLLIGEFTGTAGGTGGQVTFSSNVNPDTQLPVATLTPAGGVKAAQALMGFVLSSAVRQGNLDAIAATLESIPIVGGIISGHVEKYSQSMRENLGIGRMLRFAFRPIFQDLVATPLKWAINLQYRPTPLNAAEAARAFLGGAYKLADYMAETALGGLSDARAAAVLTQHTVNPEIAQLLVLRAAGQVSDDVFDGWLGRRGFDASGKDWTRKAADLEPARRVSLAWTEHLMLEWLKGNITTAGLRGFIDGLKTAGFLLTPGEVTALENLTATLVNVKGLRRRYLFPGQLARMYIDGTITLEEYEDYLRGVGYIEADVQSLGIEVLIQAKKAAEAAAKHAAAKKKGSGPATSPNIANPPSSATAAVPPAVTG